MILSPLGYKVNNKISKVVSGITSPTYIIDLETVEQHFKTYCEEKPVNNRVLFSVKSSHDSKLLNIAKDYVCGYDISNLTEFNCIPNTKNKIVSLCGPVFTETDLKTIQLQHTDRLIVVFDSLDQYNRCKPYIAENTEVMFRICTAELDDSFNSAFGIGFSDIPYHKNFIGLHIHMSRTSCLRSVDNYLKFIKMCASISGVKTINLGGGQHYYDWFALRHQLNSSVEFIIEPGQPFFTDAIYAIGEVFSVKPKTGYSNVLTSLSIDCHLKWSRDKRLMKTQGEKCYLFGPTCQGTDLIGEYKGKFTCGDKIVFENINPLTLEIAASFNGIQKAGIIYV